MAKKTAPKPKPQLVHIPSLSADNPRLSKAQKEFNRLTKRIAKLEKDIEAFREAATRLRQRVQNEYRPLQAEHNGVRADLVRLFDRALETYKLTKGERRKIVDLLLDGCHDLVGRGHADLQPIFDKYAPPPASVEEEAEEERQTSEAMKQLFTMRFGIAFDPAVDVSTREKFQAYVDEQMAAQQAGYEAAQQEQETRRATRKKSPKQQAAEAQKLAEEQRITKSVRALYMDLVKALHPDLEPDDVEKARKTALLQQVTAAYEANELLTLLRLQLELAHIDQSHLENLAEDQLRHYNKLLREQAADLDEALYEEQQALSGFTGQPYYALTTPAAMEYDFKRQTAQLQAKIKQLAAEVLAFEHDPAALKAWLKAYRMPRAGRGPIMIQL